MILVSFTCLLTFETLLENISFSRGSNHRARTLPVHISVGARDLLTSSITREREHLLSTDGYTLFFRGMTPKGNTAEIFLFLLRFSVYSSLAVTTRTISVVSRRCHIAHRA